MPKSSTVETNLISPLLPPPSTTIGPGPVSVPLYWFSLFWYPSLKFWAPVFYMICPPLPLYNSLPNSPLCCIFSKECAMFLFNIFSALFCLWFLSNLTDHFCHYSIELEELSASANFLLIPLFNPLLNSSMRGYLLYPLPLTIFLNSWMYLLYVLPPCSIVLYCSTFLSSSPVSSNSFLIFLNSSSTVSTSNSPFDSSSNKLSFYASATPPCI